jgi:hypothetical protein
VITSAQAAQYLDQTLGISVPSFVLDAAVSLVGETEAAMIDAGYSASTRVLVQSMAVALVASGGDPRRIASQGAPSGASRSFKYSEKQLSMLRRSLAALDTAGTVSNLVGPDPAMGTLFMVV